MTIGDNIESRCASRREGERAPLRGARSCSSWWRWRAWMTGCRHSCRAGSSSASRWRGSGTPARGPPDGRALRALDAKIREELRRTIRQIQRELQITTILVHARPGGGVRPRRPHRRHAPGPPARVWQPRRLYVRPRRASCRPSSVPPTSCSATGPRAACPSVRQFRRAPPREVVAVLRPEEVQLSADEHRAQSSYVGRGTVEEVLFAGAVERLRVRMAADGPVPVAPGRRARRTWARCSRFPVPCPSSASFQWASARACRGRASHPRPATPISSFTAVAPDADLPRRCAHHRCSRAGHAHADARRRAGWPWGAGTTRHACHRRGPGSTEVARWHLQHGAVQLMCVPAAGALPDHVVIHTLDAESRRATLAVAASLLRTCPRRRSTSASHRRLRPKATVPCRSAISSTCVRPRCPSTVSTCAPNCGLATWRANCNANSSRAPTAWWCWDGRPDDDPWHWLESVLEGPAPRPSSSSTAARHEHAAEA